MKKIYTEKGLDELIRIYGFEHKKVIEYAKGLTNKKRYDTIVIVKGEN